MRVAYLDAFAGISGDMFLGAMLDAGLELDALIAELRKIPIDGWELTAQPVLKRGIAATQATVRLSDHNDHRGPHDHHGRTCEELVGWIQSSTLASSVVDKSVDILWKIAAAEGKVHGAEPETVHFHELAGVDTVVDIVGAVAGLQLLGVERVVSSPLPVSHGFIDTAHGTLPVPPPAVAQLLCGFPTRPLDVAGETVTPTGAALATCLAQAVGLMPAMTLERIGHGAGTHDWPTIPNVLRLFIGERHAGAMPGAEGGEGDWESLVGEQVVMVEANLDNLNPELLPIAMERVLAAGALDAWLTPVQMKKGRPGTQLTALTSPNSAEAIARMIIEQTGSLGVRMSTWDRRCLPREFVQVITAYGSVRVKLGKLGGRVLSAAPEFEDCRALADERHVSVRNVYAAALAAAQALLTESGI